MSNLGPPSKREWNPVSKSEREIFESEKRLWEQQYKKRNDQQVQRIEERAEHLAKQKVENILNKEREKLLAEAYKRAKRDIDFKENLAETTLLNKYKNDFEELRSRDKLTNEEREVLISIMSKIELFISDATILRGTIYDLLEIKIERYTVEDVSNVLEGMKLNKYVDKIYPARIGDNIGDRLSKKMINNIVVEILKDRNIEIRKRISTSGKIRGRTYYRLYPQDIEALTHMRESYRKYSNFNKEVDV
jgi:hypothetical protein